MNKITKLALLALAAFGLSVQGADVTTNDWWDVTFEDNSFQENFPGLVLGELGSLTNNASTMAAGTVQPYAEGVWTAMDGDESYITNGIVTNVLVNSSGSSTYLKLDTQGNDLTWTAAEPTNGVINVVNADLFLVGSDSAPDVNDFDTNNDVQTAIYLKNETDPDTGDTTNSVLCVYVTKYFSGTASNVWQELAGVEFQDNAWAHVQVVVNHDPSLAAPQVSVTVNGTQMYARDDASKREWDIANPSGPSGTAPTAVSSIAFRGTGAVDNFVGKTLVEDELTLSFVAQTYVDDTLQAGDAEFNPTVTNLRQKVKSGSATTFEGFAIDDYSDSHDATYALSQIVLYNPDGTVLRTINYSDYSGDDIEITPDVDDSAYFGWVTDEGERTGGFTLTVPTATAVQANDGAILAKVYYQSFGAYKALAVTDLAGTVSTNAYVVTTNAIPLTTNWTFAAVNGASILSTIQIYGDATFAYASDTATVSVTLNAALAADTVFAEAVYTNGTLAAGQTLQPDAGANGLYTFSVVEGGSTGNTGAKSQEGFIILDPEDPAANDQPLEFTGFNPAAGAGNATATIEAAMLNPNGATSVTLRLIYRTSLTGADQYVNATVSNIDTAAGTATVTFELPDEDTLFLIGFDNQTGVVD